MKKILVTGNNGLLGQVVTKVLSDSNKYFPVFFKTENLKRNIINVAHCQEALEGVDGVIHLASCQAYKNATDDDYFDINVRGTYLLRESALKKGINLFLFTSSQDIYDKSKMPESGFNENSKVKPSSIYSQSKLNAEKKLMKLDTSGLVIFRLSVILGNWLIPNSFFYFLINSLKKNKIEIYGDGKRLYDFLLAHDIARVFIMALDNNLEGVYNLGYGKKIVVSDIATILSRITNSTLTYLSHEKEKTSSFLDCRKILNKISFIPTDISKSVEHLVNLSNKDKIYEK